MSHLSVTLDHCTPTVRVPVPLYESLCRTVSGGHILRVTSASHDGRTGRTRKWSLPFPELVPFLSRSRPVGGPRPSKCAGVFRYVILMTSTTVSVLRDDPRPSYPHGPVLSGMSR